MIIRANASNNEYQYSKYKPGDVFEVINDFGEYYTARFLSGSQADDICAVKKTDCEPVHLGTYKTKGPSTMTTDD
tara:strand:- start:41 stop:265 length:225 start_codon:yes stop_codon:yes gene_type:complete